MSSCLKNLSSCLKEYVFIPNNGHYSCMIIASFASPSNPKCLLNPLSN